MAMQSHSVMSGKDKFDRDLEHRLVNFLHARHVPECERLHVRASSGTVVVQGRLASDRTKWLCVECCRHVAGVIKLVDEIDVDSPAISRER